MTAGLRRVLDKRPAYESLLCKFMAGQAHAVQTTRTALAAGRRDEALRAMQQLGDVSMLPDAMAQLGDPFPAVRATALLVAEGLGCNEGSLIARVTPPDPALQIAALEALVARASDSATSTASRRLFSEGSPAANEASLRALGDAAATPVMSALKLFREEFEAGMTTPAWELFPYERSTIFPQGGAQ